MASKTPPNSKLFTPLKLGTITLQHRISMAPLTRFRADKSHTPLPIVKTYYEQRASSPGTLLISEGTYPTAQSGGYDFVPGLWEPEHLAAWREVTDAVHAKGSFIFCQLWVLGRAASTKVLGRDGLEVLSSSDIPIPTDGSSKPRAMSEDEIWSMIGGYALGAKNAVEVAGFDGVEIHGANGYMVDQFTQDTCNNRTDRWGGSVENRARFGIEVAKAVVNAVGKEKVGIRLSPYNSIQGMGMEDPEPQFTHLIRELKGLDLAYLHMVQPRVHGILDMENATESLDWAIEAWGHDKPLILAGAYTIETANKDVEKYKDYELLIAFGRHFIANPDLPYRLRKGLELNKYNRSTFYAAGKSEGYIDYPFSKHWEEDVQGQQPRL